MLQPNIVGNTILYLDPGNSQFTEANLQAMDTAVDDAVISPYAHTATVPSTFNARNFFSPDAWFSMPAGVRNSFGIFLSPQNEPEAGFMFNLDGKVSILSADNADINVQFFFGRQATNNTVTVDLTAPQNTLALYRLLPMTSCMGYSDTNVAHYSILSPLFAQRTSGLFNYCFGFYIENQTASAKLVQFTSSLAIRKHNTTTPVFQPRGC